jgi:hypothetical protein
MATTQVSVGTPSNLTIFNDTAMDAVADAIKASSAVVYSVKVDNTLNGAAASYVKLFNLAAGSVTPGTTAPDEIIYVPAGAIVTVPFFTGANPGVVFAAALSAICVTTGGTAGVTAPSGNVSVSVQYV